MKNHRESMKNKETSKIPFIISGKPQKNPKESVNHPSKAANRVRTNPLQIQESQRIRGNLTRPRGRCSGHRKEHTGNQL